MRITPPPPQRLSDRSHQPPLSASGGVIVLAGIVVAGFFAASLPLLSPIPPVLLQGILGITLLAFAVTASLHTAVRTGGYQRITWSAIALSSIFWTISFTWWAITDTNIVTNSTSIPSLIFLAGVIPLLAALFSFGGDAWETGAHVRILLDIIVMVIAAVLITFLTTLSPLITHTDSAFLLFGLLSYPLVDIALVATCTILAVRTTGPLRGDLLISAVAFMLLAISGSRYAIWITASPDAHSAGSTGVIEVFIYYLAPASIGIAALTTPDTRYRISRVKRSIGGSAMATIPDAVAFAALLFCIIYGLDSGLEWTLALVMMLLTTFRQIVLHNDNSQLYLTLEDRVQERTSELELLARHHRRVLDSVGDGIIGTNSHGQIQLVNPAASIILGWSPSELLNRNFCSLICAAEAGSCALHHELATSESETIGPKSYEFKRRNGNPFMVEATVAPMTPSRGAAGIVVTFRDITEREQVSRMKREFVSAVSHELRTPLTAIHGSLEILEEGAAGNLPAPAHHLVQVAVRGSERLTRLVNDIIDVERLETGQLRVNLAAHRLSDVIEGALRLLQPIADSRGVHLVQEEIQGTAICDPDRINQVITNLVDNALKFTPPGLTVTVRGTATRAGSIVVEVQDQGRGIPPDQLDLVFRPFHQVAPSDSEALGGTGLGLAITAAIIEQHQGQVWVESTLGTGSIFCFSLPSAPEPSTTMAP